MDKPKWQTEHWVIHNAVDKDVENLANHPHIQEAAQWILKGEVIAFPTETVYGLAANALSDKATQKIFEAKGRPSDNPLIVHISDQQQLQGVVDNIPGAGQKLMAAFWPGPLTVVLPKGDKVCSTVTAGLDTVAVRMPNHPVALALIHACGKPLAAPSANRSGKPSPTTAEHVLEDLKGRIVGVVDGGGTGVGVESTVVDVTGEIPIILRPGGITKEQIIQVVGQIEVDPSIKKENNHVQPKSPGMKYQHYAPEGEMWLVTERQGLKYMREQIQLLAQQGQQKGYKVGILTTDEGIHHYQADVVISAGTRENITTVARRMYQALREFDQQGVQLIYSETFPEQGIGEAIMNRLYKAAGGRVID